MNWFTKHRQDWIAEMLRIYGYVNRSHLQKKFGISEPQASADLTAFQRARPAAMMYDTVRKCYVPGRRKVKR